MQRGVRHRYAADLHRLEFRNRRDDARASDGGHDILDDGGFLPRRKLVCDRPARRTGREPEPLAIAQRVDFVDDAIDFERKPLALRRDLVVVSETALRRANRVEKLGRAKPPRLEALDKF